MTNFQKNFFQCRNRDTIASNFQLCKILIESLKELRKLAIVLMRNLNCHLRLDFTLLTNVFTKLTFQIWQNGITLFCVRLYKSKVVPDSKLIFQKDATSDTTYFSLCHDSDTITQDICLIHIMGCKENNAILFLRFQHVPKLSSSR